MRRGALAIVVALVGCGDNRGGETTEAGVDGPGDVLAQLAALPGVTVVEVPAPFATPEPLRYFDLRFTLPIDHGDPAAGTFELRGALIHRDVAAPLVIYTSGYDLGWPVNRYEPAELVDGNQLSLEHRFYGESRPAGTPWPRLRIAQGAADEHAILDELGTIYRGRHLATGASKGGETALFHHYLYPGDYDGVIAYVAPLLTAIPDERFAGGIDRIGLPACRERLRALQRAMLVHHAAMEDRVALDGNTYVRVGVARAVETAVVELEFWFWMTRGAPTCPGLPDPATASDIVLAQLLSDGGGAAAWSDQELATWNTPYTYQAAVELGYPTVDHAHLDDLLQFRYEDLTPVLPLGEPTPYDATRLRTIAGWVARTAEHVVLVYGEWDPWSDGAVTVEPGRDARAYWAPHGSHWSTGIYSLPAADRAAATALVRGWAGVTDRARVATPPPASLASRGPGAPRRYR